MNELIQRIREHYVEQLKAFVAWQRQDLEAGAGEVKLQLNGGEGIFRGLYCVDFLATINGEMAVREMQPDRILIFEPFHATLGQALFEVSNLRWDDLITSGALRASYRQSLELRRPVRVGTKAVTTHRRNLFRSTSINMGRNLVRLQRSSTSVKLKRLRKTLGGAQKQSIPVT